MRAYMTILHNSSLTLLICIHPYLYPVECTRCRNAEAVRDDLCADMAEYQKLLAVIEALKVRRDRILLNPELF